MRHNKCGTNAELLPRKGHGSSGSFITAAAPFREPSFTHCANIDRFVCAAMSSALLDKSESDSDYGEHDRCDWRHVC